VTSETPAKDRTELDLLCAAGVHIAAKEEYTRDPRGGFHGKDQSGARAVAPAHNDRSFKVQRVHHGQNVGCHQLVRERPRIARAAAVAAAIDEHRAMAGADQHWNLIAPIATVTEAAMQQDHGRAGPVCRVPDSSAVVFQVALIACDRQGRGAARFEVLEVVVV